MANLQKTMKLSHAIWAAKVRGGDFYNTAMLYTKRGLSHEMVRYPFPTALSFLDRRILKVPGITFDRSK